MEGRDCYDGAVQGIYFSRYNGLETHNCGSGLKDRIDAAVWGGCVGLPALDAELKSICRAGDQTMLCSYDTGSFWHDMRADNDVWLLDLL